MQSEVRSLVVGVIGLKEKRREEWLRLLAREVSRLHPQEGFDAAVRSERQVRYWPVPGDHDDIVPLVASAISGTLLLPSPATPSSSSTSASQNDSPSSDWSPFKLTSSAMEDDHESKRVQACFV
jgi:hypothetical protein